MHEKSDNGVKMSAAVPTRHGGRPSVAAAPGGDCGQARAASVRRRLPAAYTLIEMMAVIVIISVLAAVFTALFVQARNHAKRGRAETQLREICKAWTSYYSTYKKWPDSSPKLDNQIDVPMTYENLEPLFAMKGVGVPNPWNTNAIPFLSVNLQPGQTYCDPWGHPYKVSFRSGTDAQESALRIAVDFPNRTRYQY
jgi:prepilin-type N-terminal cleavage/methylation domain-containing protein